MTQEYITTEADVVLIETNTGLCLIASQQDSTNEPIVEEIYSGGWM